MQWLEEVTLPSLHYNYHMRSTEIRTTDWELLNREFQKQLFG